MPRRPGGQMESREGKVGAAGWPPTAPVPRPTPRPPPCDQASPAGQAARLPLQTTERLRPSSLGAPVTATARVTTSALACWPPM